VYLYHYLCPARQAIFIEIIYEKTEAYIITKISIVKLNSFVTRKKMSIVPFIFINIFKRNKMPMR